MEIHPSVHRAEPWVSHSVSAHSRQDPAFAFRPPHTILKGETLWEAIAKLSQSLQPCENSASPREYCHCIFLSLAAHFSHNSEEVLQYEQLEPVVLTCALRL